MSTAGPLVRGVLSALVTLVAVAAVAVGVFVWDRLAGGESTTIPAAWAAGPHDTPDAAGCRRAQPNLFAALSAHVSPRGTELGPAQYAVAGDGGLTYLTAPVGDSGDPGDPVWVYGGSGYAWLNEEARRVSPRLPDARAAYGADPAGPAATRLASCAASDGN